MTVALRNEYIVRLINSDHLHFVLLLELEILRAFRFLLSLVRAILQFEIRLRSDSGARIALVL